jgi:hypothetical protein
MLSSEARELDLREGYGCGLGTKFDQHTAERVERHTPFSTVGSLSGRNVK